MRFSSIDAKPSTVLASMGERAEKTTLEINFFIGKLKHTVKRVRKDKGDK